MFCISRTKHVAPNYDNVRVAPRTLVKAVLNVSSTGCNNERQSFTKLSYSAIDNVLTNLLPAGLQDFFQVLSVSNAMMTVNQMLEYPQIDALKTGLFGGHFFGSTNSGTWINHELVNATSVPHDAWNPNPALAFRTKHRCKKTFSTFLFWSPFYIYNVFFIFQKFFYFKKALAKFRAASRLTRSTFKITATKQTYDLLWVHK